MEKNKSEHEVNPFKKGETRKHIILIKKKDEVVFGEVEGGGKFKKDEDTTYQFILKEEYADKNLFAEIRDDAKRYFRDNGIKWWQEEDTVREVVPGHTLSSQVACLNHLFRIKNDEKAVIAVINGIKDEYDKVLAIPYDDEKDRGFIAFEVISDNEYLGEYSNERKRGEFCTSIDALIYAHHKPTDKNHIILIEWKYTELYNDKDKDKSNEDRPWEKNGENGKGHERMKRYNDKIEDSNFLIPLSEDKKRYPHNEKDYQGTVYYREPFYQLMRQTLWAEQMINEENREQERVKAQDYLHIHVIPKGNTALLNNGFKEEGDNLMEKTWKNCLNDEGKKRYIIIDPEVLLKPIEKFKEYRDLIKYLKTRYWRKYKKKK